MAGPADTYLRQHPELFRNNGAMTKEQRYDNTAQKKYGSKSTSVLPPEFTQEQLEQMYVQSRRNGTPWNGPVPNITLARQLEQIYGQDPNLANPLIQSINANPISDSKQMQDARQPESKKMGTVGPTTYNKAQAEIKEGQEKEGTYGGSDFYAAKRAHEEAYKESVKEGQEAKMLEHVAKVQPHQDPAAVSAAKDNVKEAKDNMATVTTTPADQPTDQQKSTEEEKDKEADASEKGKDANKIIKTFGDAFRRDVANAFRPAPDIVNAANASLQTAASKDKLAESADRQMEAQSSQQIANQNPYTEAGKMASVQNDAENRQNVQKAGVLGAGAALARKTNTPDVASQMARQDSQRNVAAAQREKANQAQGEATGYAGGANLEKAFGQINADDAYNERVAANGGYEDPEQDSRVQGLVDNIFNMGKKLVSDEDMKHVEYSKFCDGVRQRLSDARMKNIRDHYEQYGMPEFPQDLDWLMEKAGSFTRGDKTYDPSAEDWGGDEKDESVLNDYANYIRNYVYTYKPEAQNIDPSIDPNDEHIGPMAQDIEQVNPMCVNETPEGVKTVDTSRLAMMNAGAIGDIARQLKDIQERLSTLGI